MKVSEETARAGHNKDGKMCDSDNVVAATQFPANGSEEGSLRRLVTTAAEGNEDAWASIVERYNGLVVAVARNHRLSPADAADVAQTTWLRLLENLRSLRDPDRLGSWLAVTARNEALRALRKAAQRMLIAEGDTLISSRSAVPGPETHMLKAERDAELWRAVEQLPSRCQRLFELLMNEPAMSYRQIAATLGMPVGSIGPTRARCLACLRQVTQDLVA